MAKVFEVTATTIAALKSFIQSATIAPTRLVIAHVVPNAP